MYNLTERIIEGTHILFSSFLGGCHGAKLGKYQVAGSTL